MERWRGAHRDRTLGGLTKLAAEVARAGKWPGRDFALPYLDLEFSEALRCRSGVVVTTIWEEIMQQREDIWLRERLAEIDAELDRLDARAPVLNAEVADPSHPRHEQAKWTALWDLRQRALLVQERNAVLKARQALAGSGSTQAGELTGTWHVAAGASQKEPVFSM